MAEIDKRNQGGVSLSPPPGNKQWVTSEYVKPILFKIKTQYLIHSLTLTVYLYISPQKSMNARRIMEDVIIFASTQEALTCAHAKQDTYCSRMEKLAKVWNFVTLSIAYVHIASIAVSIYFQNSTICFSTIRFIIFILLHICRVS